MRDFLPEDVRRRAAEGWPERPALESDSLGRLPRANLSVKVSALTPLLRPEAPEVGREDAARRMDAAIEGKLAEDHEVSVLALRIDSSISPPPPRSSWSP